jgi:predicted transcriptional regulator
MEDRLREVLSEIANVLQSAQSFAMRQRALAQKSVETAQALEKAISRAVAALQSLHKEKRQ